jgi:hypothetical protein
MKPTITLLIGSPLSGDEARFLRKLYADLDGVEALILANFFTPNRQIDFVVVTPSYAAILELKNSPRPIFGQRNGVWTYESPSGQRLPYVGENPWQQAMEEKFALSDEMLKFQRQSRDVPAAGSRKYFKEFAAFVCVYPEIHSRSQVTPGDHRVRVASYKNVVDAVRSATLSSSWSAGDWRRFAEHHLGLTESTLDESTCPDVREASEKVRAYRSRLQTVIGANLPPLFSTPGNESHGESLITQLFEQKNFTLLGPSGSTKTFHLHHAVLALAAKGEELPLLIEAKRYRGTDFWTLLRHGTAPLFPGDPRELLDSMKICGLKPILMVDALNECSGTHRADLVKGVQAFALRYGARVIVTSQDWIELPGDIAATPKKLALPNTVHKRSIYAYHAQAAASPELDYFCSGFTNAYDLTIAGMCHSSFVGPESRTDLYDRYVRRCLREHTAVATALLRHVAAGLSATFSFSMSRDEFERTAERFLADQQASLTVIDQLRASRL